MSKLGLACVVAVWLVACGDDTSSQGGSGAGGSASTTGGNGSGAATSTGGNTSGTGGNVTGTGGAGGAEPICTADPNDSACVACAKDNCCGDTTACLADTACAACVACIDASPGDPSACLGNPCDLADPLTSAAYNCTAADTCYTQCYGTFDACAATANDTACTTCAKGSCCMQLDACVGSASCLNCLNCVSTAMTPTSCLGTACDIAFDPPTQQLLQCVNMNCSICTN